MAERIQKILSSSGVTSRRTAEAWIKQGRVTCNGKVCVLGQSADLETDEILVDGKPLPQKQAAVYILLHKPKGYVTTLSDEKGRKNVSELTADCGQRVYPVGRLDMDSEGLLLMTNDGEFANRLMHPKHEIDKTYLVDVADFAEDKLHRLSRPITLDGYRIRAPKIELIRVQGDFATLRVVIHEGRNRQVRRMCAAAGMKVKRLVRVGEGSLTLGDLPPGKWRYLSAAEVEQLMK